jgi:DNA-binding transcriptional LysR family regulator
VDELRGLVRGRVTVGAMLFGGELDIPALLASFTKTFPHVELRVHEGTAQEMLDALEAGGLDVAFALEVEPPDDIERLGLSSEELAVVMSARHPLAGDGPLEIGALAGQPLIAFSTGSSTRRLVDRALAAAGAQARVAVEANELALVRSLAAHGFGVAILPRSFVELPGPRVASRRVKPTLHMTVALWWKRGRPLSPAARAFVQFADDHRPARNLKPPAPHSRSPR